jgi:hypothetical protein
MSIAGRRDNGRTIGHSMSLLHQPDGDTGKRARGIERMGGHRIIDIE